MNCKPGDLAVRVRALPESGIPAGAIVECREFAGVVSRLIGKTGRVDAPLPTWYVNYRGSAIDPSDGVRWALPDADLRPIRDQDGEDETLRIAGKPLSAPKVTDQPRPAKVCATGGSTVCAVGDE